jgi:hypothetical protein
MKVVIPLTLIAVIGTWAYVSHSHGATQPAPPPTPAWICGSFDIESEMCSDTGYWLNPGGCECLEGCSGNWTAPPDYHAETFYSDPDGWKVIKSTVQCTYILPCIYIGSGDDCSNDEDCGRDWNSPGAVTMTHYSYVQPFPQWCNSGPL